MSEFSDDIDRIVSWGGSAFPVEMKLSSGGVYADSGMSLRDYFAAVIIGPALSSAVSTSATTHAELFAEASRLAYEAADAMLEARKK